MLKYFQYFDCKIRIQGPTRVQGDNSFMIVAKYVDEFPTKELKEYDGGYVKVKPPKNDVKEAE